MDDPVYLSHISIYTFENSTPYHIYIWNDFSRTKYTEVLFASDIV